MKPQKDVLVTHKHCFDRTDVWELSPVSRKTKDVYLMKSTYYNRYVSTKPNRPLDGKGVYQAALAPWLTFMSVEKCIRLCPVPGIKPPPRTPLPPTPPVLKTHDLMVSV